MREARDAATAAFTESKVALASDEQLASSFRQQRTALEQRIRELTQVVQQRKGECSLLCFASGAGGVEKVQDSRAQIERLAHERSHKSARRPRSWPDVQKHPRTRRFHARGESAFATRPVDGITKPARRTGSRAWRRRIIIASRTCAKKCSRSITPEPRRHHRSECITITYADEGPAKVETLTPEQMAASGVATDWNSVAEQV